MSHPKSDRYSYNRCYYYSEEPHEASFANYPAGDYSEGETDEQDLPPEEKYSVQTQPSCPIDRCPNVPPQQQWHRQRMHHMPVGSSGAPLVPCPRGSSGGGGGGVGSERPGTPQMDVTELYRRKTAGVPLPPPPAAGPTKPTSKALGRPEHAVARMHAAAAAAAAAVTRSDRYNTEMALQTPTCNYYSDMPMSRPGKKYMHHLQAVDSELSPSPPALDYYDEEVGDFSDGLGVSQYEVDTVSYHHSSPQLATKRLRDAAGGSGPPPTGAPDRHHVSATAPPHAGASRRLPSAAANVMRAHSGGVPLQPSQMNVALGHHHRSAANNSSSVRRVPSVLAPRYYRRSAMTAGSGSGSGYKRPSKLCLPLACQPDYAYVAQRKHRSNVLPLHGAPPRLRDSPTPLLPPPPPASPPLNDRGIPDAYNRPYYPDEYDVVVPRDEAHHSHRTRVPRNKMNLLLRHTKYGKIERYEGRTEEGGNSTSDVDAILTRYETVFDVNEDSYHPGKERKSSSKILVKNKLSKGKICSSIPLLKPRVPATIKARQDSMKKLQTSGQPSKHRIRRTDTETTTHERISKSEMTDEEMIQRLDVEEVTTDVLDKLLEDLMSGGCIDKTTHDKNKALHRKLRLEQVQHTDAINKRSGDAVVHDRDTKKVENSGSTTTGAAGISDSRTFSEMHGGKSPAASQVSTAETLKSLSMFGKPGGDGVCGGSSTTGGVLRPQKDQPDACCVTSKETVMPGGSSLSAVGDSQPRYDSLISGSTSCTPQDHEDSRVALELHRSKSYIINLIDRALSKELGTSPEPRVNSIKPPHRVPLMSDMPQVTAECLRSTENHIPDAEICSEIAAALTESFMRTPSLDANKPSTASAYQSGSNEEPPYVKQLKQIRWGHLKHIQQEIRRLEDLERFLDTCSTGSPFYQPNANLK